MPSSASIETITTALRSGCSRRRPALARSIALVSASAVPKGRLVTVQASVTNSTAAASKRAAACRTSAAKTCFVAWLRMPSIAGMMTRWNLSPGSSTSTASTSASSGTAFPNSMTIGSTCPFRSRLTRADSLIDASPRRMAALSSSGVIFLVSLMG